MDEKSNYDEIIRFLQNMLVKIQERTRVVNARVGPKPDQESVRLALQAVAQSNRALEHALTARVKLTQVLPAALAYLKAARTLFVVAENSTNFDFSDVLPSSVELLDAYIEEINAGRYDEGAIVPSAPQTNETSESRSLERAFIRLNMGIEAQEQRIGALEKRIADVVSTFSDTYDPLTVKYQAAIDAYNEQLSYLGQKRSEVDDLVGLIGGEAVAGSYQESAKNEKKAADRLRAGSLGIMGIVLIIVGYSFFEATKTEFNVQASVLRLVYSVFLSVPAAYLARESTKHRQQQYIHLQTALDLKAITPYIATLPAEAQDKLKQEMALKIFTPRSSEHLPEGYPLNLQELLIALVNKVGSKGDSKGGG